MSGIHSKTTTIGKPNKIAPKKLRSTKPIPEISDDIIIEKSNKLTYYILGGFTFVAVSVLGVLLFMYIESGKKPIKTEQEIAKVSTQTKQSSVDDSVVIEEEQLQPKSLINLEPKTKDEQYSLGIKYIKGEEIDKNYTEAIKWFTLAATQEHTDSQLMLGKIYYYGEFVKPDFKKALMWNTLAAAQGLSEAQYMLGLIYENGSGVPENKVEAKKWYTLAAEQGLHEAKEKISIGQSKNNNKSSTSTPKLVTTEDLNQVNKYLSNIQRDRSKAPVSKDANDREIIWN